MLNFPSVLHPHTPSLCRRALGAKKCAPEQIALLSPTQMLAPRGLPPPLASPSPVQPYLCSCAVAAIRSLLSCALSTPCSAAVAAMVDSVIGAESTASADDE